MSRNRVICFAILIGCVVSLQTNAAGIINDEQAVEHAKKFFADVGWQPSAHPEKSGRVTSSRKPHRLGVWLANLHAEVDAETGKIRSAGRQRVFGQREQLVINISELDAPKKAEGYLRAAGLSLADTRLEEARLHSISDNPGDSTWHITYRRTYKGYPFFAEAVEIDIDPLDGSLIGFGDQRESSVPEAVVVKLTKEQAATKGREYLAELGLTAGNTISAEIISGGTKIVFSEPQIVQPWDVYEYWEVHANPPDPGPASRLAWVVAYDAPWESTMVFVDTETGNILGGGFTNTRPKHNIFLSAISAGVDEIVIQPADGKGEASRVDGKSTDAQALVKSIPAPRPTKNADTALPIGITISTPKRIYTFGYSAENHRLVLLTKVWNSKTIKGNLAWETTKEFEDLIAKYVPAKP